MNEQDKEFMETLTKMRRKKENKPYAERYSSRLLELVEAVDKNEASLDDEKTKREFLLCGEIAASLVKDNSTDVLEIVRNRALRDMQR